MPHSKMLQAKDKLDAFLAAKSLAIFVWRRRTHNSSPSVELWDPTLV
jgi:hypothetical protein